MRKSQKRLYALWLTLKFYLSFFGAMSYRGYTDKEIWCRTIENMSNLSAPLNWISLSYSKKRTTLKSHRGVSRILNWPAMWICKIYWRGWSLVIHWELIG